LGRFRYSDYGISPNTKCVSCGEKARDIRKAYGDFAVTDGVWSEKLGGWVCYPCQESADYHPRGRVFIYIPKERKVEKWVVKDYEDELWVAEIEDESELENPEFDFEDDYYTCPIQFEWHSTDPWRGYYETKSDEFIHIHEDCILAYSRDAEELKKFHIGLIQTFWKLGVEFAIVYGTTSNLFSTSYDVYVKKENLAKPDVAATIYVALNILKIRYRDPERFVLTALTGKSEGFDEKDWLLAEAYRRIKAGENPEEVQKDILEKARRAIENAQ